MLSSTSNYRRSASKRPAKVEDKQHQVSGSTELTDNQKQEALRNFKKRHSHLVVDFAKQPYADTLETFLREVDAIKSVSGDQKKAENWNFGLNFSEMDRCTYYHLCVYSC